MAKLRPEIARIYAAKEARRKKLAELPLPEKIKIVIKMQEMVAPILRARGKKVRVWNIED